MGLPQWIVKGVVEMQNLSQVCKEFWFPLICKEYFFVVDVFSLLYIFSNNKMVAVVGTQLELKNNNVMLLHPPLESLNYHSLTEYVHMVPRKAASDSLCKWLYTFFFLLFLIGILIKNAPWNK